MYQQTPSDSKDYSSKFYTKKKAILVSSILKKSKDIVLIKLYLL